MDNGDPSDPIPLPDLAKITPKELGEGLLLAVQEISDKDELWADIRC